ncbi:transglutaminase [Citricoccus sp. SGAir0253]|uniref:transglutaminase-like domain-containing protein n=1 Tax=Citricoccus sp. SGAir0253 TaxID=2567881 RepID=UPI0010CD1976|nr:transglutaminase domain-containing protein [Citricoccus sp. SGAir0253]QCU78390.1 transglutaminase [Citricoccus sp. SGAir0253]
MRRQARSSLTVRPSEGTRMVLAVAAADAEGVSRVSERLAVRTSTGRLPVQEVRDHHGGRFHVVDVPAGFGDPSGAVGWEDDAEAPTDLAAGFSTEPPAPGSLRIEYACTVQGAESRPVGEPADLIRYVRPSRYAESDKLFRTAAASFGTLDGLDLLAAVDEWVHDHVHYVPGFSRGTDGAVDTFLARQGVCRDFAHLVVALLRARNVPARVVAAYAPGLDPMDFHAVAEAWVGDAWHLVDATRLADTTTLLRISTGADSSDTAFLSTVRGGLYLDRISVDAVLLD